MLGQALPDLGPDEIRKMCGERLARFRELLLARVRGHEDSTNVATRICKPLLTRCPRRAQGAELWSVVDYF